MSQQTDRYRSVIRLVRRYQRLLGLDRWDIEVKFGVDEETAACNADDEYMRATLTFDLARIPEADEGTTVRHELAHCLTWELVRVAEQLAGDDPVATEAIRAASERCTTLIERMPVWDTHDRTNK